MIMPICESQTCRSCTSDTDCASGACNDDGSCVAEDDIAYVAPDGIDAAPCARAAPCHKLGFAVQTRSTALNQIVMLPGNYEGATYLIGATRASSLVIHGAGATMHSMSDDGLLSTNTPMEIIDLTLEDPVGTAFGSSAASVLRHVTVRGRIDNGARMEVYDTTIEPTTYGIWNRGTLVVERTTFRGGTLAIMADAGTSSELTNLMITETTDTAIQVPEGTGFLKFSTVAYTGTAAATTAGILCSTGSFAIDSSIIWTATPDRMNTKAAVTGCLVTKGIVGPIAVSGISNFDPLFVDPVAHDLHLSSVSPALNAATSGPSLDFERQPRPQGAGYDLGADERE